MFVHLVVALFLCWPHVTGTGHANHRDEAVFDQIATASENAARAVEESERKQEFRDQLITSIIDTTVHYENSNGFMPMLASPSPVPPDPLEQPELAPFRLKKDVPARTGNTLNQRNDSSTIDGNKNGREGREGREEREEQSDEIENDPAYSTEARIILNFPNLNTNRRSFAYQGDQNDFELLKVRNDTPIVANYPDLYEDPSSSNEDEAEKTRSLSNHRTRGKGQNLDVYMGNYGMVAPGSTTDASSYGYYYSRDSARDKEREGLEQKKVTGNYHRQDATSYNGRGQTATRQNGPIPTTSPRPSQEVDDQSKNAVKNYGQFRDTASSPSRVVQHHTFARPVVVAEPNYHRGESSGTADSSVDDYRTSRIIEGISSEVSQPRYAMDNRNGRFRSDEDSWDDASDDGDYVDYTERPRKVQKSKRRPGDGSKRLQKEHRGSMEDGTEYDSLGKRHHSSRSKSHRQRYRGNSWTDEDRHRDQEDSYEDTGYDGRTSGSETRHAKSSQQSAKFKPSTSWNQISPNLEISHSSGIEIGQLEKPKLIVPVKVNLVPLANFDHATAIGNSQGFDVSNAVLRNIVSATPVPTIGTPSSVLGSQGQNAIGSDAKFRVSTPIPDIVVGQNSFQNSIQAMYPQLNEQQKFSASPKPQYVSSTVPPIYAVTPGFDSKLHGLPIQDVVQASATPRPTYLGVSEQVSTNHLPQLIVPQPTLQTVPTLVQTPVTASDYIQVNPHGMHGQNLVSQGALQVQPAPTMATITPTPQTIPVTKFSLLSDESQNKKTFLPESGANFLTTASLAVGQNDQRQILNGNSYYLQNSNGQQIVKPQVQGNLYQQVLKNVNVAPKTKTYIQTTHLLPALVHPMPTLTAISASTPQTFAEQQSVQGTNLFLQPSREQDQRYETIQNADIYGGVSGMKSGKYPSFPYQAMDSMGSHSGNDMSSVNASPGGFSRFIGNAHLPHVGTRNVEIVNPGIKPSPMDAAVINSYETMHYPAAVLTTSIPMFTTTSFVTARPTVLSSTAEPLSVQSLANSLTEIGTKDPQSFNGDSKAFQSQDRPMFNPINFVPNMDVVKNQNALNGKLHATEPLQENLNLVPLIPGGNFFKPFLSAQSELLAKPKLTTDLETYAEQMFKESLKTIYNSQKWNNDRKPGGGRQNVSDVSDIAKLRSELRRLKASLSDSKRHNDQLEGHYSETKPQTAELPGRKPDELLAALEQMLKKRPADSSQNLYGNGRPNRHRRPGEQDKYGFGSSNDFKDTKHVRDFLTPPQPHSHHRSKGPFRDKPGKKRPGPSRYHNHNHNHNHNHYHGPKPYPRNNLSPKVGGPDASSSNIEPVQVEPFPQFENTPDSIQFGKGLPFDSLPTFTGSSRDKNNFLQAPRNHKGFDDNGNIYDHPKMHNLLGLLMKNKQLPRGGTALGYFRGNDRPKEFLEDENQRMQQQFYNGTLNDYFYKLSEGMLYSNFGHADLDTRRSLSDNRTG